MLTKNHKIRLQKICKVLFPKYRYVKIDTRSNIVIFKNSKFFLFAIFKPQLVYSLDELIQYRIPRQFAEFLYGNEDFLSIVQENLIRCKMLNVNIIDYLYEEISKIKYSDIYKAIKIDPDSIVLTPAPISEEEMWDEMIQYEQERVKENKLIRLYKNMANCKRETFFYTFLTLIVLYYIIF